MQNATNPAINTTGSPQKARFVELLEELFQLNQPELDFGLYRIVHARSKEIRAFMQTELAIEIDAAFAGQASQTAHSSLEAARLKVIENFADDAFDAAGNLKPEFQTTKLGKEFLAAQQQARDGGGPLANDAQVYDHLYRFFSRYYDKGDFMSKRYFVAENDQRALPYAVPYDGREVLMHWANKDQYYVKSSEAFSHYSFDLNEALRKEADRQKGATTNAPGFDFGPAADQAPLKVHFRLAAATEGEHNNVKDSQERFFLIHAAEPVKMESGRDAAPELVIQFEYRADAEKTGQANTWQQKRLAEAEARALMAIAALPTAQAFAHGLAALAPTEKRPDRTLLAKYLGQFASRNTMDYFIHKDLGGFLRRELDFYIKNEIMRLDDIESAEAPRVDSYLIKLRVLRRIAKRIIEFLAQLENFQRKLWLKKRFVVETQYCMTLDQIPKHLYPDIAANTDQRKEWISLFAIDEIKGDLATPGYSNPLTLTFLQNQQFLVLDTKHFPSEFKDALVANIRSIDDHCNGLLLHSENFQALQLMGSRLQKSINCIYIDPPYNTGDDGFPYKDGYPKSSWLAMMTDRLSSARKLLREDGIFYSHIDDNQLFEYKHACDTTFGNENFLGSHTWLKRYAPPPDTKDFGYVTEALLTYRASAAFVRGLLPITEDQAARYKNADKDKGGPWKAADYTCRYTADERPTLYYEIVNPNTGERIWPKRTRVWAYAEETHHRNEYEGRVWWGKDGANSVPALKNYLSEINQGKIPGTLLHYEEVGHTDEAAKALREMFPTIKATPKPIRMSQYLATTANSSSGRFLDFFAGTGSSLHGLIEANRDAGCNRTYIGVEVTNFFDDVLLPRVKKSCYSRDWVGGKPVGRKGISQCAKYLRLESFEDSLNNLLLPNLEQPDSPETLEEKALQRDYMLSYWLDFETANSPSLLNVKEFADPTAYKLKIKQPGADVQVEKAVDLVETFNWLIGLHVALLDRPRRYAIDLQRTPDPDLPDDQQTRWQAASIKEAEDGEFWFRLVDGHVLAVPGDEASRQRVLVIWRKLTGDAGRDQAALEAWLAKVQINPRETEYTTIYLNGSHALPSDGSSGTRLRLTEEAFAQRMWEDT